MESDLAELWAWEPPEPRDLPSVLAPLRAPWWVAGGWAIDLFLGRATRRHPDLDVALLRRDQHALHDCLPGWELRYATPEHTLESWPPALTLELPVHGIWARRPKSRGWTCEFLLDEADGNEWRYRRDPRVTLPLQRLGLTSADDVSFLAPEVVLLYKSKAPLPKDDADLDAVLPALDDEARGWLADALARADPQHAWLDRMPTA